MKLSKKFENYINILSGGADRYNYQYEVVRNAQHLLADVVGTPQERALLGQALDFYLNSIDEEPVNNNENYCGGY